MPTKKTISIVAISGSLKSTSSSTNILRAMVKMVSENITIKTVDNLNELPHFNPETKEEVASVSNLRQQLKEANGVIFSTPEYAFGVPGVLKNALDWLVSSGELNEKPVAAISASPLFSGGDKALTSLLLTLKALGANIDAGSSLSIGNIKSKMNESGEITAEETVQSLELILSNLLKIISLL